MGNSKIENLDYCLKCSICHVQCPVLNHRLDYPGPKHLGPELERIRLARQGESFEQLDESIKMCLNCKRCDLACPHGVKPAYYNLKNKEKASRGRLEYLRDWALAHNNRWGKLGSKFPGVTNLILANGLTKRLMATVGIAPRNFPRYKGKRFSVNKEAKAKKALYFAGCYASFNQPEIVEGAVKALERMDYQVELAPQDCCGTPMFSNGLVEEGRHRASDNIKNLTEYIKQGYKVITTCSSCGLALKEEYKDLLATADAGYLAQNVWDIFELIGEEGLPIEEGKKAKIPKAVYHIPCHLRAQGIGYPASKILSQYGVEKLIVEDSYCCGLAGTYGFKAKQYDLSLQIGGELFGKLKDHQPAVIITDCGTCQMQIFQGTALAAIHPIVLLQEYL